MYIFVVFAIMFRTFLLVIAFGNVHPSTRIIGGQYASLGEFPHQVSLQIKARHHCGGSLISEKVVITAAHCTFGHAPSQINVIAGTVDLLMGDGIRAEASHFIIHPKYNPSNQDFDLSLIILNRSIPFSSNIKAIELTSTNANYAADTLATVSGFGAINGNMELPNKLKYAKVQLWSRDYCNPKNIPGITDRMICAGHPSGQVSSCQGDSGGPLTVENQLFGIVSWGFGCGAPGRPAIYTYIGSLTEWIKENSGI